MRGSDDRAAANQRSTDALDHARRQAILDCQGDLQPDRAPSDRATSADPELKLPERWDRLNVHYLHGEWPFAWLN